jgi:hypothetical protein
MLRTIVRSVLACALASAACSDAHTRGPSDASSAVMDSGLPGASHDAAPSDAGPHDARVVMPRVDAESALPETLGTRELVARRGQYLRAVLAPADQVTLAISAQERCKELPADARVQLDVSVRHTACDALGPISFGSSETGATIEVWLWRANADCSSADLSTSVTTQVVTLNGAPGSHAVKMGDVTKATLVLGPRAQVECAAPGRGDACNCECSKGSICVFGQGSGSSCSASCQLTCDNVVGCNGVQGAACTTDATCPAGLGCTEGHCHWSVLLGQDLRKVCSTHADCAAGLACIEGEDGKRGCEVACNAHDMVCPGLHYCDRDSSYSSAQWVCEWGGE